MKILLLGEYSNVHATLAKGLRALGHEVLVVSDGDCWKGYPRDIDLRRRGLDKWNTLRYLWDVKRLFRKLSGFDVVQLINPEFLTLRAERISPYFEQLVEQNGKIVMGAFGMDYYWIKTCLDGKTFRYSDFNIGNEIRHYALGEQWIADWYKGPKGMLTQLVAERCDGIVTGLYEYNCSYQPVFPNKTHFIPLPIDVSETQSKVRSVQPDGKVHFFIGIQRERSEYKGTDIMLSALLQLQTHYPERVEIKRVENVPFAEYCRMMDESEVLLDQLYAYTPAMNALLAMSQGLLVVGGGEPEAYDLLGDTDLRPVVNVLPSEESVYLALEQLMLHPERIAQLSQQSIEYVRRYHDHLQVARQYADFYASL